MKIFLKYAMSKVRKNENKYAEERRRKNRERMRRKRELVKENAVLCEELKQRKRERYHRRVGSGKIKKTEELSQRSKRQQRKIWREKSRKSLLNKKQRIKEQPAILDMTPPGTPKPIDPAINLQNGEDRFF
jgi:hypothetical protein